MRRAMAAVVLATMLGWAGVLPAGSAVRQAGGEVARAVVQGLVEVVKDSAGYVQVITITTSAGRVVLVHRDELGLELERVAGHEVCVTGAEEDGEFYVQTWFLVRW